MRALNSRPWWLAAVTGMATLLVSAISSPAVAAPSGDVGYVGTVTQPATETLTVDQALEQARKSGKKVKATRATTETDVVTANPNGTLTLTRSLAPARQHVDGQWKDLDATLTRNADGTFSPAVSTSPVAISGGGTGPLAKLSGAGLGVDLSVPMALPTPTISGDTATYAEVLPGVNLQVKVSKYGGFSEVFVVRNAAAAASPALKKLVLAARPDGINLASDGVGNLVGKDVAGRTVLSAPIPLMWDSSTVTPTAAANKAQKSVGAAPAADSAAAPAASNANGPGAAARVARIATVASSSAVTLTPGSMLQDSATKYPLYIDPDFQWSPTSPNLSGWATIATGGSLAGSNFWKKTPEPNGLLQIGYSGQAITSRTLLNFALPVSTLKGAKINSAELNVDNIYSYSCNTRAMAVYAPKTVLTSSNATWNDWSSVSLGAVVQSQTFAHGYNSSCPAKTVGFDVTDTIADDMKAATPPTTQTFALKAVDEDDEWSWKKFTLSGMSMTITYNHVPKTPAAADMKTSPSTSCNASPASPVGDGPLSLYATVSDQDSGVGASKMLGVGFQLYKTSDKSAVEGGDTSKLVAFSPMSSQFGNSTTAVLNVKQDVLETASGVDSTNPGSGNITQFSWRVRVTDFPTSASDSTHYSGWSTVCTFRFDPTRTGAPTVGLDTAKTPTPTQGQPATITIDKNSAGGTPSRYLIQVNGGAPFKVDADGAGNATAQVQPNRFTNFVSVTSLSAGGNIGEGASLIINAAAAELAQPDDLNGDDLADLVTVGGTNNLPAGLWLAAGNGNGQVNPVGTNIGAYGTGATGTRTPTAYNGTQVITGPFTGNNIQDVLVYHPQRADDDTSGTGSIINGSSDGSPLQPDSGTQIDLYGNTLQEITNDYDSIDDSEPQQIVNVGNLRNQEGDYPGLLGISQYPAGNYHLNYYASTSPGSFDFPIRLTDVKTPTDGADWNNWTLASTVTHDPSLGRDSIDMFLHNRTNGALYLWRDLKYDTTTGTFTHAPQYILYASGWKTGSFSLQAADINRDGTPDLWTIDSTGLITAHLISGLTSTPVVAAQPNQTMLTGNHAWLLNDNDTGNIGTNAATDSVGGYDASGASAGATASTDGATWDTGDLFSPAVQLNVPGPDTTTKTGYLSVAGKTPVATNASFTLSVWAKPTTGGTVLSQDGKNTAVYKLWADPSDKSWRFAMSQSDVAAPVWDTAKAAAGSAPSDLWSQVTVTYDAGRGTIILYVNAVNAASASHTKWTPTSTDTGFRIGAHRAGTGTATAGYFGGKVAYVQTWDQMWKYPVPDSHDFNGDGRNDVITTGSDGKLWLYPNRGSGLSTFGAAVGIGSGWGNYRWDVSDWDLDGYADIIAIDSGGTLWWYPNNHTGAFRARVQVGTGWGDYNHATGNGDTNPHPDHYGIKVSTGEFFWYPNGRGKIKIGNSSWGAYKILPYDFNEDGRDDVIARDSAGAVWFYPHTGQNGTGMLGARTQLGSSLGSCRLGAVDVDNDGKVEMLCVDLSNNVWAYPSNGVNGFNTRFQIASGWTTTVAGSIG